MNYFEFKLHNLFGMYSIIFQSSICIQQKNTMNTQFTIKKTILIYLILFVMGGSLTANNRPFGGQINSSLLDTNRIKIRVSWDLFCNSNFPGQDTIRDVSYGFFIGTMENRKSPVVKLPNSLFKKDSITNLDPICKGYTNTCMPGGTANGNKSYSGNYRYYLSTIIHLKTFTLIDSFIKKYGSDQITFIGSADVSISQLVNNIKSPYGFTISTTLHYNTLRALNRMSNDAPFVRNHIPRDNSAGEFRYFPDAMDAENDRLTFKLQQPYEGPNSYAAYSLNNFYSVSVPIKTFTGVGTTDGFAKANRNIFPPRGFSFDSLTGEMYFYKNDAIDGALFCYTINETQKNAQGKWVIISQHSYYSNGRFINSSAGGAFNYNPYVRIGKEFSVVAGETIEIEFSIGDPDTGTFLEPIFQTTYKNTWLYSVPNKPNTYIFKWKTDSSHSAKPFHIFNLLVMDNYCSSSAPRGTTVAPILVRVKPAIPYENASRDTICNRIITEVKFKKKFTGNAFIQWLVTSKSGKTTLALLTSTNLSEQLPDDEYYITPYITHDSLGFIPKTDTIVLYRQPKLLIYGDSFYCRNSQITFKTIIHNISNLARYSVKLPSGSSIKYNSNQGVITTKDTNFKWFLTVMDSFGCFATDTSFYIPFPKEHFKPTIIPDGCTSSSPIDLKAHWTDYPKRKYSLTHSASWIDTNNGNLALIPKQVSPTSFTNGNANLKIDFNYLDSWGCKQSDSIIWIVKQPLKVQTADTSICQNHQFLNLNSLIQIPENPSQNQPKWTVISAPNGVDTSTLLTSNQRFYMGIPTDLSKAGTYLLKLNFGNLFNGCYTADSVDITVVNEPELTFTTPQMCRNVQDFNLFSAVYVNNQPAQDGEFYWDSYDWNKKAPELEKYPIQNKSYAAANIATGNWRVRYMGPQKGCQDTGYFTLRVEESPKAIMQVSSDTTLNIHAAQVVAINYSYVVGNDRVSWFWDAGDPNSNSDTSSKSTFIYTYPKIPGKYKLNLVATTNQGCTDTATNMITLTDFSTVQNLEGYGIKLSFDGKFIAENSEWKIISVRWFGISGMEIKEPKQGISVFRVELRKGNTTAFATGKFVH